MFDVCRWLVELIDGSPLLIAPWRQTDLMVWFQSFRLNFDWRWDFLWNTTKMVSDGGGS